MTPTWGSFLPEARAWVARQRTDRFFRLAVTLTLTLGIYLHVTSVLVGREVFLDRVLTPTFDLVLAVPMTYAAVTGWLIRKRLLPGGRLHRAVYVLLCTYLSISVPVHAQTLLTGRTDTIVRAFPENYSLVILPVMLALLVFVRRLRFSTDPQRARMDMDQPGNTNSTSDDVRSRPGDQVSGGAAAALSYTDRDAAVRINDRANPPTRFRAVVLRADAAFLGVAGLGQGTLELLGYFGAGPQSGTFHEQPFTIGFFEAHGLAVVIAAVLLWVSTLSRVQAGWHLVAAAVHGFLMAANLTFWDSFETYDMVGPGTAATVAHGVFLAAQVIAYGSAKRNARTGEDVVGPTAGR
jgi:hypothetical protein